MARYHQGRNFPCLTTQVEDCRSLMEFHLQEEEVSNSIQFNSIQFNYTFTNHKKKMIKSTFQVVIGQV